MRLAGYDDGGAAPEIAAWLPKSLSKHECLREALLSAVGYVKQRGRGVDHGGELPRVRLEEAVAPIEQGTTHAVAVSKAVTELAECVDMAERRPTRAQHSVSSQVSVSAVATHRRCRLLPTPGSLGIRTGSVVHQKQWKDRPVRQLRSMAKHKGKIGNTVDFV
ncbi:hypothetical protein ZWY2020_000358 [Hordeum vulgare]|nr:hypothetical protein ZWY2020_000358 [Hordeum vulgare]